MLPVSATLATILASNARNGIAEIVVQFPVPGNNLLESHQILLDGITSISISRNEDQSADSLQFQIANPDGRYNMVQAPTNLAPIYYRIPLYH